MYAVQVPIRATCAEGWPDQRAATRAGLFNFNQELLENSHPLQTGSATYFGTAMVSPPTVITNSSRRFFAYASSVVP